MSIGRVIVTQARLLAWDRHDLTTVDTLVVRLGGVMRQSTLPGTPPMNVKFGWIGKELEALCTGRSNARIRTGSGIEGGIASGEWIACGAREGRVKGGWPSAALTVGDVACVCGIVEG